MELASVSPRALVLEMEWALESVLALASVMESALELASVSGSALESELETRPALVLESALV
jgi:hypothetical protein